ncbi:hypothetical protein NYQ31_02800 [Curtobacterium flaccumfaciens]|uniref:hypothetical protein n=1 Tax=Curtobacterium flaccumfaciens TaxID=2035 RepID=UPI00217CC4C2|nr:hypothetical protein [Curtobacterium flaccumfaciens]MCS6557322.1 hypothetical protein [Curtobacterium flaccumfaciens]
MSVTVIIRPKQRTEIQHMPFEAKGAGYKILEDMIGASRRGQVEYSFSTRTWSVSRPHSNAVILGLAARYGRVKVIQHGGVEKCVEACWKSGHPEKAWECECACAGRNHGSGSPYRVNVGGNSAGGDLSVQASAPNVFYVD